MWPEQPRQTLFHHHHELDSYSIAVSTTPKRRIKSTSVRWCITDCGKGEKVSR